jgi:hypothetical protein
VSYCQKCADLEAKLKRLDWQEITPENLPQSPTDEVGAWVESHTSMPSPQWLCRAVKELRDYETWLAHGWTHFRPITPPRIEEKPNGE